jgi:hypothetical protein
MSSVNQQRSPAPDRQSTSRTIPSSYKWLLAVAAAIVLIALGLAIAGNANQSAYVPEVTGAPQAAFATTLIDHGDIQMEDYAESVFEIKNTGDQTLVILDEPRVELVQGCCPPRAMVSRTRIEPGETATISLRFTMHEMMGGQHEFRVHVPTNDPDQPLIPLTILSNWIE